MLDNMKIWFGIAVIILLIILLIIWVRDIHRLEEENSQLQIHILAMEDFYNEIKDKIDATRKYRHDLAKHIQTMEQLVDTYHGNPAFQEKVERMKNEFCQIENRMYADNELIDIICQIKKRECDSRMIQFFTQIDSISALPVSEMDMTGLLQNLLDNGIEACERMKDKREKEILLEIHHLDKGLEISLKNTCDNKIPVDFQTRKKRKEEHGFGIKIIREIVNKANGKIRYSSGEGFLTANVFLPYHV